MMGVYGFSREGPKKHGPPPSPQSGSIVWVTSTLAGIFSFVTIIRGNLAMLLFVVLLVSVFSLALTLQSLRYWGTVYRSYGTVTALTSLVTAIVLYMVYFTPAWQLWSIGTVTYGMSLFFLGLLYWQRSKSENVPSEREHVLRTGIMFVVTGIVAMSGGLDLGTPPISIVSEGFITWVVIMCMVSSIHAYSFSRKTSS